MVEAEPIEWCEAIRVSKLYDGDQFAEVVLEWCAREQDIVGRVDAPYRPSSLRVPVLEALHFVHDE